MQINNINAIGFKYTNIINKNINFSKLFYKNYTNVQPGTYLPKNEDVVISKDSVLLLAGDRIGV